jgi:hypothetical protein
LLIAVLVVFDVARSWIDPSTKSTVASQAVSANSSLEPVELVDEDEYPLDDSETPINRAPVQEWVANRGQYTVGFGPLHEYMVNNLAEIFGFVPDEIQKSFDQGNSMWDLAQEHGLSADEFKVGLIKARANALAQAVADGAITQAQADRINQNTSQILDYGNGIGICSGGGRPNGMGRGRNSKTNSP